MAKPTDVHPVLVSHLQTLVTALDAAYGLALSEDLARQYRNVEGQTRPTRLTRLLEDQRDRFEAYVEEATRGAEPVEVSPDE
jgi:hypothetical protein